MAGNLVPVQAGSGDGAVARPQSIASKTCRLCALSKRHADLDGWRWSCVAAGCEMEKEETVGFEKVGRALARQDSRMGKAERRTREDQVHGQS